MAKRIKVPDNIEQAETRLATLDGIATATGWERAAIVYAFTYDAKRGGGPNRNAQNGALTVAGFAALKIKGLTSRNTIDYYRQCWKDAMAANLVGNIKPEDVLPGSSITLPTADFPPQERNAGSRTSADPEVAVKQVIEKHGADVAAKQLAQQAPKEVAKTVANPKVAKEVVENKAAKKSVIQQESARTRRIINRRKAEANAAASAQTDEVVETGKAAMAGLGSASPGYNAISNAKAEAWKRWLQGIKDESFTPFDRHLFGSDLASWQRLYEEMVAFVEAEDDPYEAVRQHRVEREEEDQRQYDGADADVDIDQGLEDIERYVNESSA